MLQYNTDLFDKAHVARLAEHLTAFYTAAASAPQKRISELPLMSANERRLLVEEWNTTVMPVPNGRKQIQSQAVVGRYLANISLGGLRFLNWRQHLLFSRLPARMLCPRTDILNDILNGSNPMSRVPARAVRGPGGEAAGGCRGVRDSAGNIPWRNVDLPDAQRASEPARSCH
jgi:hypothetical protein